MTKEGAKIVHHKFNTILSLVGYMGHNYAQIGGKITPNFLQCVNTFANALQGAFANV